MLCSAIVGPLTLVSECGLCTGSGTFVKLWENAVRFQDDGEVQNALAAFSQAAGAASEDDDLEAQRAVFASVAIIHRQTKNFGKALTASQRHLELSELLKEPRAICVSHLRIAQVYLDLGKKYARTMQQETILDPDVIDPAVQYFRSAAEHYNHALNLARALSDRQFLLRCYKKLGSTHRTLQQPQLALEYLELHLKTARAVGTPKQKESAARMLADLLSDVPDDIVSTAFASDKALFERLVELRWEQAAAAQQAELKYYCLHAYFHLGRLMEDSGSYTQYYGPQKAAKHYQKVLEIGKELQLHELGQTGAQMVKESAARLEALEAGSCVIS